MWKISARRAERISIHSDIYVRGFDFKGVGSKHQVKLTHRNFHHLWKPTGGISNRSNCYCSWPWWKSFFCLSLDAEESNGQCCGKWAISFVDNCNNSYHYIVMTVLAAKDVVGIHLSCVLVQWKQTNRTQVIAKWVASILRRFSCVILLSLNVMNEY